METFDSCNSLPESSALCVHQFAFCPVGTVSFSRRPDTTWQVDYATPVGMIGIAIAATSRAAWNYWHESRLMG